MHRCIAVFLGLICSLSASQAGAQRPVTESELSELIAHLEELPPQSYDIEVIVEFELEKLSRQELEASVRSVYKKTDDVAPNQTAKEREQAIEREVERLFSEQEHPRRIRERRRYSSDFGLRLDMVIEDRRDITVPIEDKPFSRSFVNPANSERSFQHNHRSKISSLYKSGKRIVSDEVWVGGTVGIPAIIGLKGTLQIGRDDEESIRKSVLDGTNSNLAVLVQENIPLPDETVGRRFICKLRDGLKSVEIQFEVPSDSFQPVWRVIEPNRIPLEVRKAKDGLPVVWVNRGVTTRFQEKTYTVVSRKLNVDLPESIFRFTPPEGYASVDHTVNPPKIVYPDGNVEFGDKKVERKTLVGQGSFPWILIGNLLMVIAISALVAIKVWRSRAEKNEGNDQVQSEER